MPDVMGNIPYMRCMVRGEYLRDRKRGAGEFVEAVAYGVRCVRGSSIWFQCALGTPYGGVNFLLPIQALVSRPCLHPAAGDMTYVQPWDVFSSHFGVVEFDFLKRGAAFVLPERRPGQYQFTIDFTGSDLADDPDQHKHLHIVKLADGLIGAFPNNRVLTPDAAFWPPMDPEMRPDFLSLSGEYRAEGHQHLISCFGAPVLPPGGGSEPRPAAPCAAIADPSAPQSRRPGRSSSARSKVDGKRKAPRRSRGGRRAAS